MPRPQRHFRRTVSTLLRWFMGLLPAALTIDILLLLPTEYRAPYLIAFLFSVATARYLGLGAGTICAIASGIGIEFYLSVATVMPPMMVDRVNPLRAMFFIGSTVLVGWLMCRVTSLRRDVEMKHRLDKVVGDSRLAHERTSAAQAVRERETRLQMALDGGHVGLWDNDLEHEYSVWSDEHYRILGLEPQSVSAGPQTILAATHPEDRAAMDALYKETKAGARPFRCEYRVVWPNGSVHWVEAQAKYEADSEGKAVRMLGVMSDITHRKQAEAALIRTEKLAVAGRLAATIAHEINNPLEAVANLLYLVSHAENLETARQHAQQALGEVMRVSRITQQTLKFHRQSEAARKVRLSEVIDDVFELLQGKLTLANITVDRRYRDDPEVECLAGDLRQVFANLVSNAVDAMKGGGSLVVRIRQSHDWHDHHISGMRITLLDTGCGMDPETRRRIFEPFFTTKKESGTGLGLWVTSEIIGRQLGSLRVWSSRTPGRSGTIFSLFLPLRNLSLGVLKSNPKETTLQPI
ncbi:MAG: ATP-binding protein [Acidobacteriaceae bacterium]